jgi:hypothetical protein
MPELTTRHTMPSASRTEHLALAQALFSRADLGADGRAALAKAYPLASDAMVSTAAFHVYVDGCDAALAFLADAERFLRDPSVELDSGVTWELLHHVYNWHQFRALLPDGKPGVLELLAELKQFVAEDDREALLKTVGALEAVLEGSRDHPDFE